MQKPDRSVSEDRGPKGKGGDRMREGKGGTEFEPEWPEIVELSKDRKLPAYTLFNLHPIRWRNRDCWLAEDEWGAIYLLVALNKVPGEGS